MHTHLRAHDKRSKDQKGFQVSFFSTSIYYTYYEENKESLFMKFTITDSWIVIMLDYRIKN